MVHLRAVDPGDVHVGTVRIEVTDNEAAITHRPVRMGPEAFEQILIEETDRGELDLLVVESFRLYPKMAREQGYSEFLTPQLIGVIRFIARRRGIPVYMQGASIKKMALQVASTPKPGFPLQKLRGGRRDFEGRNQHERDAVAHGFWWAHRNDDSPLVIAEKARASASRNTARARQKE